MDKKDRYGRDRRFSGPVDRDNGRREREGPCYEQGARYGIRAICSQLYDYFARPRQGHATTLYRGDRTFFFSRLTRGQPGTLRNS